MAPPICSIPQNITPNPESLSLSTDLFAVERLFCDPAHPESSDHWAQLWDSADSSFRLSPENSALFQALYALRTHFFGAEDELSSGHRSALEAWAGSTQGDSARPLDSAVLRNLRQTLMAIRGPLAERAGQVLEIIGRPSVQVAPDEIPLEEEGAGEEESTPDESQAEETQDEFVVRSMSLETHFLDEEMRILPSIYTLGILPAEGLTQNQSSTFAMRAGLEARLGDYEGFFRIYAGDAVSEGARNATFFQSGIMVGLTEYSNPLIGNRGEGFYASLGGMSQVGIGLGYIACIDVQDSEVSGRECDGEGAFQISVIDQSDLISLGYGPLELGIRVLPRTTYLNFGTDAVANIERDPIAFRLSYHFNPLPRRDPQSVIRSGVTGQETAVTALGIANNAVTNHYRGREEAGFELTRPLFLGNAGQYSLLNTGTAFNALLSGLSHGSQGYRLHWNLRHGNDEQRILLGSLLGLEFLANAVGAIASPGLPDEIETFPGRVAPDDFDASINEGIANLHGHAFHLNWPTILVRDALAVAGALGAFGDRNEAIEGEAGHFLAAHVGLGLAGGILILTSGDLSGDGFFQWSILGNQLPGDDDLEPDGSLDLNNSRFSIENQRSQYLRFSIGTMALTYALNGLIDYVGGRLEWGNREENSEETSAPAEENGVPTLALSADLNSRGFQLNLSGQF